MLFLPLTLLCSLYPGRSGYWKNDAGLQTVVACNSHQEALNSSMFSPITTINENMTKPCLQKKCYSNCLLSPLLVNVSFLTLIGDCLLIRSCAWPPPGHTHKSFIVQNTEYIITVMSITKRAFFFQKKAQNKHFHSKAAVSLKSPGHFLFTRLWWAALRKRSLFHSSLSLSLYITVFFVRYRHVSRCVIMCLVQFQVPGLMRTV